MQKSWTLPQEVGLLNFVGKFVGELCRIPPTVSDEVRDKVSHKWLPLAAVETLVSRLLRIMWPLSLVRPKNMPLGMYCSRFGTRGNDFHLPSGETFASLSGLRGFGPWGHNQGQQPKSGFSYKPLNHSELPRSLNWQSS